MVLQITHNTHPDVKILGIAVGVAQLRSPASGKYLTLKGQPLPWLASTVMVNITAEQTAAGLRYHLLWD